MQKHIARLVLAGLIAFIFSPVSQALVVGPGAGSNPTTVINWNPNDPNYELPLTEVAISAGAPYWIKELVFQGANGTDRPVINEGTMITMTENIQIGGSIPFVDWHEIFSSDGWSFTDAAVYYGGTNTLVDGLSVVISKGASGLLDMHDDNLLLSFNQVAPGTILRIEKTMRYDGLDVTIGTEMWGSDKIIIRQFPETIIPEPVSLGLVALGGSLYGLMRRRRRV